MYILANTSGVHFLHNSHNTEPLEEHVPFLFHDCLGREIKVGDVLANGQRQRSHGGIRVGIVRGFTERSILVDVVDDGYPSYNRGRDHTMPYKDWTLRKSHFTTGYNCLITGMTEPDLYRATNRPFPNE